MKARFAPPPSLFVPLATTAAAAALWIAASGLADDAGGNRTGTAPARLDPGELAGLDELDSRRRELVVAALQVARDYRLDRYLFGSADPARGGFDCSGSVYYLLRRMGLEPPRTSSAQFSWLKKTGTLVTVPEGTRSLDDEIFDRLKPGDLLFWSGTYQPKDGRTNGITHVQIYLGREARDGRSVMIGSSNGRSYRGRKQCGYGVYDFRLPRPGSRARFVGFGPPPGLLTKPSE